ncbi:hypothetical protein V5N11_003682 [Cardamine amara subsp. amara]|uniref:DUF4283 domain-containing protein n=1 Tax=Cardamine amara subsp. amara TaxID=228776 RepID=A0ABD0ZT35_CARAN
MSSSIDRALMALSIGEEDEHITMPDLPEFCSSESNFLSIIGRVLNPVCQKVGNLVLDMPRKWKLYDRVRGIALSKEKFQFIFRYEKDLLEVWEKGVHTYNEWALVLERWVEFPPSDYLQNIMVWVQMRNIPVNHYNVPAITWFGELVGRVEEVILDTQRSQRHDFVRVKLKFDVSKPLHRAKSVNLPKSAGVVTIFYDFERVQKRCFTCQRLTHEQLNCPVALKKELQKEEEAKLQVLGLEVPKKKLINESDPLFGIIEDEQIEVDKGSGVPKIDKSVLEGMRQYLLMADGAERIARAGRIKSSLEALKNDPIGQKTMLRLEKPPLVSSDINKDKGIVFDYGVKDSDGSGKDNSEYQRLSRSDALRPGRVERGSVVGERRNLKRVFDRIGSKEEMSSTVGQMSSTGYSSGSSQANFSGTNLFKKFKRKRPGKNQRFKFEAKAKENLGKIVDEDEDLNFSNDAADEANPPSKVAKRTKKEVVPNEGPSNA